MFTLTWQVDEAGYEWFPVDERERPGGSTILTGRGSGATAGSMRRRWELRTKGGSLRTYRPFDHPDLARRFAGLPPSREAVLGFVNQCGLLDDRGGAHFDEILHRQSRLAHIFAEFDDRTPPPPGGVHYPAEVAASAFERMIRLPLHLRLDFTQLPPRLSFVPRSLYGALCVQAACEIAGLKTLMPCLNCGQPITIGPGERPTRRKFCSDRCRFAWRRRQPKEN